MAKPRVREISREEIAAAAVRCFERYGPQRTSMADIAAEAGISRQTIYRTFEDRSELIEYIVDERVQIMVNKIQEKFSEFATIDEAIVEGSIESLRAGRDDTFLRDILKESHDHSVEVFLLRGSEKVHKLMLEMWGDILAKARSDGRLRPGLTDDQILEWLRHLHAMMTMADLDELGQRRFLQTFILPSILR